MSKVKRALISVFDKSGVVPFAKALHEMGVEILSTGGTAQLLKKEGIPVKEVSEVTRFPEMLSGRVKTLHPNLHAGLLALRDDSKHMETLAEHNIKPIDLLAVNLYPFAEAARTKTEEAEIIEMIDIGGPAMLRSAAKNFRFVASVCDPSDYAVVIKELQKNDRQLSPPTLRRLASKVFSLTASYDHLISGYFERDAAAAPGAFPKTLSFEFEKAADLRYGENPHQKGALYQEKGKLSGIVKAKKIQGKELSFNNILDLDAAMQMVLSFDGINCAIMKHTNPCGFAIGKNVLDAYENAYACDPLSAFGGILGFNQTVDGKTAKKILDNGFVECVIAKDFTKEALTVFQAKKNIRLLALDQSAWSATLDYKKVSGGLLVQDTDTHEAKSLELKCATRLAPKKGEMSDLLFAFKVSRFLKSNAIVVAKNNATLGLGMGLPSRVDACEVALRKAGKRAKGAVLASDGFFPKPDSIQLAKKYGISAVIQPGGSIQDPEVIKAAERAGIRMVFTGVRHFRH